MKINQGYFVVDSHAHTYPNREVGLGTQGGKSWCGNEGTIPEILKIMEDAGISKVVMVNVTPVGSMRDAGLARLPKELSETDRENKLREIEEKITGRIVRRNSWTCEVAKEHPSLIPFIGLDPIMGPDLIREEVFDKVRNHGARGIKIEPSEQGFHPAAPSALPMYEMAQELDVPLLSDSGKFPFDPQYGDPEMFVEVLEKFPKLRLILAHLGKGLYEESKALAKAYPGVSFDCSDVVTRGKGEGLMDIPDALSDEELVQLIRDIGTERVMFGSDYPFIKPEWGIQRILKLNFTDEEKKAVLGQNAVRIIGLV